MRRVAEQISWQMFTLQIPSPPLETETWSALNQLFLDVEGEVWGWVVPREKQDAPVVLGGVVVAPFSVLADCVGR